MKDYIFLRLSRLNSYHHILDYTPLSNLKFLRGYFEIDYKHYYEEYLFNNIVSSFNEYFIYNDRQGKILHIGLAEWESDEDLTCPSDEEFTNYVNETNSCKMTVDNFLEFREKWAELKKHCLILLLSIAMILIGLIAKILSLKKKWSYL